jgi:putative oxidoreductase
MAFSLLKTEASLAPTFLRLPLGVVFFAHGCQKVLGLFGGLGLILGFLSRIAALGIFAEMAVAVYKVHLPNGLFMNWSGKQRGEGIEYHLLAVGMALAIMILGSGLFSVDRSLSNASPVPRGKRR